MNITDPSNGVYITDTRFAIARRLPEEDKTLPAYALIEADIKNNTWSLVARYNNPVVMVADLIAMQVMRTGAAAVKTLDDYQALSDRLIRCCRTALSVLREMQEPDA